MTSIVILEDEALARERMAAALQRVAPEAAVAGSISSVAEALQWFRAHPMPDLVLADIQLADGVSFELFEQLELGCPVVFCTAYDRHAIEAMTAGGIDYLLKPVQDRDLARALDRYRRLEEHFAERAERAEKTDRVDRVDRVRSVARAPSEPRRILARKRDGFVALPIERVAYFAVEEEQADVVTKDGQRFGIDQTLAELEATLDPASFFRVNRQYLVAASSVEGFRPHLKGKLQVSLSPAPPGEVIVSQVNAARFRAWLRG
jgi:DNA-binding LytR/AlgR family response regulator